MKKHLLLATLATVLMGSAAHAGGLIIAPVIGVPAQPVYAQPVYGQPVYAPPPPPVYYSNPYAPYDPYHRYRDYRYWHERRAHEMHEHEHEHEHDRGPHGPGRY